MKKDANLYLIHIIESIERIERYCRGDKELFYRDEVVYDAVIRNAQTLAESCTRLPEELKAKYPDTEWKNIAGFRNILVHAYLGEINPDIVWNVIEHYLPKLQEMAKKELENKE